MNVSTTAEDRQWLRTALALFVAFAAVLALVFAGNGGLPETPAALAQQSQDDDDDEDGDDGLTEGEAEQGEEDAADDEDTGVEAAPAPRGPSALATSGRNLTRDLDLVAAQIARVNTDDASEELVVYVFDSFVRAIDDEQAFTVSGFSVAATEQSVSARLMSGTPNAVLVGFPAGTDLRRYTIGTVGTGAVTDEDGEGNIASSVGLQGSIVKGADGLTAGPDLQDVSLDTTLNRVTYTFDKELDEEQSANASGFGYYTPSGQRSDGSSVVAIDDERIIVSFDERVEDGVLFFVEEGAVDDRQGLASTPGAVGEPSTAPGLIGANATDSSRTQLDFTFSEPVTNVDPSGFSVYTDSAQRFDGEDYVRLEADVIRVTFPAIRDFSEKIVLAAVSEGAVTADDGSQVAGTLGNAAVRASNASAGLTSGPDLIDIDVDQAAGQVRFLFDSELDDQVDADPERFHVLTSAGALLPARSVVEVVDNGVLVIFNRNAVRAADGFLVEGGAVQDFAGEPNPIGSR